MSLVVVSQVWLESQLQEAGGEVLALNGTGPRTTYIALVIRVLFRVSLAVLTLMTKAP